MLRAVVAAVRAAFSSAGNFIGFPSGSGRLPVPFVVMQPGVPVGLPSSGTVGNNGALTLTTALSAVYPHIFLFFPANALFAGSASGIYYCQMSSTTVGTVFADQYLGGDSVAPATPTPIVATGPGAYTQSLSKIALRTRTLEGGLLGPIGGLKYRPFISYPANTNVKMLYVDFGGVNAITSSRSNGTSVADSWDASIFNRGSQALNIMSALPIASANTSTAFRYTTVDTSTSTILAFSAQLAVATDFVIIESCLVEVIPS